MNRRRFFQPILTGLADLDESPIVGDLPLIRFSRRAMATGFEIAFPFGMPNGQFAAFAGLDLIDELESQLTIYRDDSEVSQLNANAFDHPVIVDRGLFELLRQSQFIWRDTEGAFDIATGSLIKAWGFYRREGCVPTPRDRAEALANTGTRYLVLDDFNSAVRFLRSGVEINLGAIGKGYALDRVKAVLRADFGIESALMNGGNSSVVAIGTPPNQKGWKISLKHPWKDSCSLGIITLANRALGTSAATYQYFEYNNRKLGHVLDPRKGWPALGMAHASVIAPTGAEADALSTAFFVGGIDLARRYCHTHPEIGAVLLPDGDDSQPVTFNLSSAEYTPPPLA